MKLRSSMSGSLFSQAECSEVPLDHRHRVCHNGRVSVLYIGVSPKLRIGCGT